MRLLSLLLLFALVAACDSGIDSVDDLTQDATLLPGTWELYKTHPYWGGENGPIDYDGPRYTVTFRPDGTFAENTSGEIWVEGPYTVEGGSLNVVNGDVTTWWLGSFGVDEDDLVLDTRAVDGDARFFRRVE